jgi:hypothetical protein
MNETNNEKPEYYPHTSSWSWGPLMVINQFMQGDRGWGFLRLICALLLLGGYIWAGTFLWTRRMGLQELDWHFTVIAIASVLVALILAVRYLDDIYNIGEHKAALHYLLSSAFGLPYTYATVDHGQLETHDGKVCTLDKFGGPGFLVIRPGNLVLTERLRGPAEVYGTGLHFIPRFERIKQVVDLSDQEGQIQELRATTKDGIVVLVTGIRFRFRVWAPHEHRRSFEDPYPYSRRSIYNLAYNRSVSASGQTSWADSVKMAVDGVISDYITSHQIDHLTAPQVKETSGASRSGHVELEYDAREEIQRIMFSAATRQKLKGYGAELIWCEIGHIRPEDEEVEKFPLLLWQTNWKGNANITRAYGEAQRIAYQELARAEAQAELLISIMHALNDIGLGDGPEQQKHNLRNLILVRTAQILEGMTSMYGGETDAENYFEKPHSPNKDNGDFVHNPNEGKKK